MHHDHIDKYADLGTGFHSIDPRVKFVATLVFVVTVVVAGTPTHFLILITVLAEFIVLSKVPIGFLLKRSTVVVPFIVPMAFLMVLTQPSELPAGSYNLVYFHSTYQYSKYQIAVILILKSWMAVAAMLLLAATTKFTILLKAMRALRFPRVFTEITLFAYRYIFILTDEALRLRRAVIARRVVGGTQLWFSRRFVQLIGHLAGTLLVRSFERGERVYQAMVARGYEGAMPTFTEFKMKPADIVFAALLFTLLVLTLLEGKVWSARPLLASLIWSM